MVIIIGGAEGRAEDPEREREWERERERGEELPEPMMEGVGSPEQTGRDCYVLFGVSDIII